MIVAPDDPQGKVDARGSEPGSTGGWRDSRLALVKRESVEEDCGLQPRTVTHAEKSRAASDPLGSTESELVIEYAVDATGSVTIGCIRPRFQVTLYNPLIESSDFVEEFGPLMEVLWSEYGWNIAEFAKDTRVRGFEDKEQTRRHEEMHVATRALAIKAIVPDLREFLRDNDAYRDEATFVDLVHRYVRVAWNERTKKLSDHDNIYLVDARTMVREYQSRAGSP